MPQPAGPTVPPHEIWSEP